MCYIWEHRGKTRSERTETVERGDRSHLWCILRSRLRPREKQETRCTSSWSVSRLLSREVVVCLCGHEHAETITYRKTLGLLDWVILCVSTQYTDMHFVFHPCACVQIYMQTSIWALFIVKMHRINRAITASPHAMATIYATNLPVWNASARGQGGLCRFVGRSDSREIRALCENKLKQIRCRYLRSPLRDSGRPQIIWRLVRAQLVSLWLRIMYILQICRRAA